MQRAVRQAQIEAEHIDFTEEGLPAGSSLMAIARGGLARCLAAPDHHRHLEGLSVAGQPLTNLAVAPDAQRLTAQPLAQIDLPLPRIQRLHRRKERAPRHEHQRPGEFGRCDGRTPAFHDRYAMASTGGKIEMRGNLAGLADQLEPREPSQQRFVDDRALARQHQSIGVGKAFGEDIRILFRLVIDRHLMAVEPGEAVQRTDDVLIVVGNHDVHAVFSNVACPVVELTCADIPDRTPARSRDRQSRRTAADRAAIHSLPSLSLSG